MTITETVNKIQALLPATVELTEKNMLQCNKYNPANCYGTRLLKTMLDSEDIVYGFGEEITVSWGVHNGTIVVGKNNDAIVIYLGTEQDINMMEAEPGVYTLIFITKEQYMSEGLWGRK